MTDKERIEELEATLGAIRQWCNAYPHRVFPEVTVEEMAKANQVLESNGISLSRIHAQWGRHILAGIDDIITLVLP